MSAPSAISNAKQLLIGGSVAQTLLRLNSATFQANTGEVGVFSPDGERLVGTGGTVSAGVSRVGIEGEPFVLAVSRGAALAPLVSDIIEGVGYATSEQGAAAVEQIAALGYNGTTGSIDITNVGQLYSVQLLLHQFLSGADSEKYKSSYYQSLSTDDEIDIANGTVKSMNMNFSREVKNAAGNPPVVAELLSAAATVATAGTVTVQKNSKLAALSVAGDVAANGDYIRFGNTTSDDVYKVESGAGTTTVTLDRAYNGVSAVFAIAAADSLTSAAVLAAAAGVTFTGQPLKFSAEKSKYTKVSFETSPNSYWGVTPLTALAASSKGNGTFEAISSLERFLIGFKSEQYRMGEPYLFDISSQILANSAVAGGWYSSINLNFQNVITNFQNEVSKKEVLVAVPQTTPAYITAANDGVSDALETLIPAAAIVGANLAL